MGRAPCCEKVGLKRGRWTAEEDEILLNYIRANGEGSWRSLPKNAGLLRCGKSCRLRWINYLRTDLKRGNISKEEEETIIKLHATMGNRWSVIASHLPGRTDNEIKNYWNSHLSRRIHSYIRIRGADTTPLGADTTNLTVGKRRGGRTSRSAMKKTSLYGKSIRKEKLEKVTSSIPTSSSVQSGEGSSMLLDLGLDEGLLGLGENIGEVLVVSPTSQLVESGIWDDVECGGLFSASEERVGGVMRSSEEGGCETLATNGGGVVAMREEGMKEKMWDDGENTWSWLWECGNGDVEYQSMEGKGYQDGIFDSWLVSDVLECGL